MNSLLNYLYVVLDNLNYFGILALAFLTVVAVVLAIFFLFNQRSALAERLARLSPSGNKATIFQKPKLLEDEENGLIARISKPLHDVVAPKKGATKKKLRLKLIRAGFRSEKAFRTFLAAKVVLVILLPGFYVSAKIFYRFTPDMFLISIALGALGFFLPNLYIWFISSRRQEAMGKALPDALDLMVVCVESGLGLDMTFKRVGDEIRPIDSNLSDEFHLTNLEIRAGRPRDESFKDLSLRTGLAEVHNLMTILIQTSRFGTSVAKALRVHADAMRIKRRQAAEEQAAKSTVKLIFPLIFFIFPGIFVVLVGPAAIQIATILVPALGGGK
jgi:tight adherence protein C